MDIETSKRVDRDLLQAASANEPPPLESDLSEAPLILQRDRQTLIKSEESGVQLDLGELWYYRELLYFLTLRDIKVRYKQTLMGVAWVIIQPLTTALIFTLVFSRFVRLEAGALPYPLFALSGLLLWLFFANAVTNSTHSLVSNANLITKVYFPRMFIPAASVAAGLVDLAVAFLLLVVLCFYYHVSLTLNLLLLPLFVFLMALLALERWLVGCADSQDRDLCMLCPLMDPVLDVCFAGELHRQAVWQWYWLVTINPIAGIIEGFRTCLTRSSRLPGCRY